MQSPIRCAAPRKVNVVSTLVRLAFALLFVCLASTASAQPRFLDSPYLERIPDPGPCDVNVTPTNAARTLARVNDHGVRVFCIAPGDYRDLGRIQLDVSGTSSERRYFRFDVPHADTTTAVERSSRARFESLRIRGRWWVVQGITIQPRVPATKHFLLIDGGDHIVVDGCLMDGNAQANADSQNAVVIEGRDGDPATHNTIQRNVMRDGNRSRLPVDYHGVLIRPGSRPGEHNDHNEILDNEIYDWGDGISLGSTDPKCNVVMQRSNVIDGNDAYVTPAKYVDCETGAADTAGQCSCAENGIESKSSAAAEAKYWNLITNNRVWGHRPTPPGPSCGGSGSNGQSIAAGNSCAAHVVVARNIVSDTTIGILPAGKTWIVAGNLVHDVRASNGEYYASFGIKTPPSGSDFAIEFNTLVDTDSAYDPQSSETDTRCNVISNNRGHAILAAVSRPADHRTRFNYLYDSAPWHFMSSTNEQFASVEASRSGQFCYWRRRWTNPQQVCVPFASTTARSPHVAEFGSCHPDLLEPFGLGRVTWPTTTPCADGVDSDGDGHRDGNDVACAAGALREDPRCQNGLDDDGDGTIDFDGGRAANGGVALGPPDPSCTSAALEGEGGGLACGLGFEAGIALTALGWLRRRQRRARS